MKEDILVDGPITPEMISGRIGLLGAGKELGGHSIFLGQVRADNIGAKKVKAIEYSAYKEMVHKEAGNIESLLLSEFNDLKSLEILHSTGMIMAGEISLLVLVSAGHRQHAIAACAKAVELIKERLPVWKKEVFEDDSHQWTGDLLA